MHRERSASLWLYSPHRHLPDWEEEGVDSAPTTTAPPSAPAVLFVVRDVNSYPDIVDSLARLASDGTVRSGQTLAVEQSGDSDTQIRAWQRVHDHVKAHETDIVILHHFHSPDLIDPRPYIRRLKAQSHRPVVALTNGDAFFNGFFRPSFPRMFIQASQGVDVVFSTSMGVSADVIAAHTDVPVSLLPHGVCQLRFANPPLAPGGPRDFEVVFIGSNNRPRNFLKSYHWYARRREHLVRRLSDRFGTGFAVFGHGWEGVEGWHGPVAFPEQQAACLRANVVVGGVPFSPARYYTSDRAFIQIASGVPFVDLSVDGLDILLRDGEHWRLAANVDQLLDRCDELLTESPDERARFGAQASSYVLAHHSIEARCRSIVATMQGFRHALLTGVDPPAPDTSFLLPDTDVGKELPLLTRSWPGLGQADTDGRRRTDPSRPSRRAATRPRAR